MYKIIVIAMLVLLVTAVAMRGDKVADSNKMIKIYNAFTGQVETVNVIEKTDAEWKKTLTPEQYRVLRQAGTERPFSGIYTDNDKPGVYRCAACGAELFTSGSKFHSGCGWPSFDSAAKMGTVVLRPDNSLGMTRTEVLCASCGGHLGHLFDDGPTATGMRYCINSEALKFEEK